MAKKREKTLSEFAQRLRKARVAKDLSQQELARRVDVHFNQISRYEQGLSQPKAEMLHKIADELEVSGGFLINGDTSNAARANFEDKELLQLFQQANELSTENKERLKHYLKMLENQQKLDGMAMSKTG